MKRIFLILGVLAIALTISPHKQDMLFFSQFVTPEVILIFDTSGSMSWDMNGCPTWGDGVVGRDAQGRDMNGDGLPNDSRLYITKEALRTVIQDTTFSFRWGLFKFLQDPDENAYGQYNQYLDPYYYGSFYPTDYCWPYKYVNDYWHHYSLVYKSDSDWNADVVDGTWDSYDFKGHWVKIGYESATGTYAVDALERVVQPAEGIASHINSICGWIDNTTLGSPKELAATGGTPLPCALRGARYYFKDEIPTDNARWCRRYFVILITDGEPTYGIDPGTYDDGEYAGWAGNGSTVDPRWQEQCYSEASALRHTYIPASGKDSAQAVDVQTYVVGVGIASTCLNLTAKAGGTKHYYPAHSPQELVKAFRTISGEILEKSTSFSSAEVTSIEEEFLSTEYEARMYLASFVPSKNPCWRGNLRSIKLVPGGMSLDSIPDELVYWNAGDSLRERDPTTRNIYGVKNGSLLPFNDVNFNQTDLDVTSMGAVDTVINLIYCGQDFMGSTAYLGDIFHSAPLKIEVPNYFYHDDDFDRYRARMESTRVAVIYDGGNDGLIHAFDDSTGKELFGVIPENFIPQIKALRDSHRFYVDADPMAADIWFPESPTDSYKDADEWRTVLMAAQGEGGRGITALDVTDPSNISYLFGFHEDTMGYTTSVPIMYKVRRTVPSGDTVERFFAFFGGGEWPDSLYNKYEPLSSDSLKANVIVALDIQDAATNGLSEGTNFWYISPVLEDAYKMVYPFASQGSMINLNPRYDNLYDLLYIPDMAGQLWKVDTRVSDVSSWEARCIFQPPIPVSEAKEELWQPAFFAPLIEKDPTYGCLWVFYGTGDRSHVFKDNTENRFYAIMDTLFLYESYPLTETNLKKVSPSGSFDVLNDFKLGKKGWFIAYDDYRHTGEKTCSYATILLDTLTFTTFEPLPLTASDPCAKGIGIAREYLFNFRTGSYADDNPFEEVGSRIPQAPRYSFKLKGEGLEIHQTSDSIWVKQRTGFGSFKKILRWKEK
mgnify:CR=1 FL=1